MPITAWDDSSRAGGIVRQRPRLTSLFHMMLSVIPVTDGVMLRFIPNSWSRESRTRDSRIFVRPLEPPRVHASFPATQR